jgi:polyisoprenoid-binding protein YceI
MRRATGWLCVVAMIGFVAPASARIWQLDAAHSTLTFANTYQGVEYTGQFRRFDARIDYDPADLAHAKFDVTVDVTSLDTQNSERDHAALGADFFDTAKFPRAHFVTTSLRKAADGKVIADGLLTLRGIGKPVTLVVKFAQRGDTATLDVSAHVKRLDFGIGTGQWADPSLIGDGVSVHGHLLLTRGATAKTARHRTD